MAAALRKFSLGKLKKSPVLRERCPEHYRVWLVCELFRGSITANELDWSEAQIRDFVLNRKSANPHLCEAVGIREETAENQSAASAT
jgi:hypothetical protein